MGNNRTRNSLYFLEKLSEKLQYYLFINHWPAKLAYKTGLQGSVLLKKYYMRLNSYPENTKSIKIAFASDFHVGPTTHIEHLKKSVDLINSLSPDILLFGGDIVFLHSKFIDPFIDLMSRLSGIKRRYFVLGNHDYLADTKYILDALNDCGFVSLINDYRLLDSGYDCISLHGIDDYDFGTPDPERAFVKSGQVKIVLMHSPANYSDIENYDFDLAFCGHTHAGQIALAGGKPIITAKGPYCKEYNYGKFTLGKNESKNLIVTSGVGYNWLPFRINTNSEVVLCELSNS
jgi:predicted MPP superfamily phosphohydrolase